MSQYKQMAENATMQSFLNCFLRETGIDRSAKKETKADGSLVFVAKLAKQDLELVIPIRYFSSVGRHLFDFPIRFRPHGSEQEGTIVDYTTLVALCSKELLIEYGRTDAEDEFMLRIILSCRNIERFLKERESDQAALSQADFEYIEAEQSLLLGHLTHPTPKSRQGMTEEEEAVYSPELKGAFQLHYFKAHHSIVLQDSSISQPAASLMLEELSRQVPEETERLNMLTENGEYVLIPIHPLQVKVVMEKAFVKRYIEEGKLTYLGPLGSEYTATSSFRTVYQKDSAYMLKFSVPVKITNSLRINKQKELDRGVEMSRILKTELGVSLYEKFSGFRVIEDPAYLSIRGDEAESGFEVVIRQNPFLHREKGASLIAGLCQDHAYGGKSRLAGIIHELAAIEGRSTEAVSQDWFKQYLTISLKPMLWLFETYGLALEAHQQNAVVQMRDGYPETFYYRDNQGYYYSESKKDKLANLVQNLSVRSETICADDVAVERLRYYFFFNHLFGLINGFGTEGLAKEEDLLALVRDTLLAHEETYGASDLTNSLLRSKELPSKANLLTRFEDMDELTGSLETQSRYTAVLNPLFLHKEALIG
ncbi:IucA/IucC family protein [Bacillus safensis]|uniref:IucA/IucC family protein n=1 Tax=Bacillus safensis TaxID=561879 RepID=UPI000651CA8B|nr:IucA/IucC family protein [Bacillus safensis]KML51394.1 IucA/IucC family siderophore biosynthesis protein [Bacillus safensis]KMN80430.1 IucA/IucC family siderophore biosynthesis protein [Bacillus safensis]